MRITSTANPAVKHAVRLREHRERRATGLFLIDGEREVRAAVAAGVGIETLFRGPGVELEVDGARTLDLDAHVLEKVAYRENPDGVVAVARTPSFSLTDPPPGPLTVLVADRIEKPGNLGAMIRTADATGAWVVVTDAATDVVNPNVIRASVGTVFSVTVRVGTADEVRAWLRDHGIAIVATSPAGTSSIWEMRTHERCAVVIGAEDTGVDGGWLRAADETVSVPMLGTADSLNAAMTAGVLLYEIARRRAQT